MSGGPGGLCVLSLCCRQISRLPLAEQLNSSSQECSISRPAPKLRYVVDDGVEGSHLDSGHTTFTDINYFVHLYSSVCTYHWCVFLRFGQGSMRISKAVLHVLYILCCGFILCVFYRVWVIGVLVGMRLRMRVEIEMSNSPGFEIER